MGLEDALDVEVERPLLGAGQPLQVLGVPGLGHQCCRDLELGRLYRPHRPVGAGLAVTAGSNTVVFEVPKNAATGNTFSRWRVAPAPGVR